MQFSDKPAWPDPMAHPQRTNENPTAAIQPFAMQFSDKPAWPDPMAHPQRTNENPTAAIQPFAMQFSDKQMELIVDILPKVVNHSVQGQR